MGNIIVETPPIENIEVTTTTTSVVVAQPAPSTANVVTTGAHEITVTSPPAPSQTVTVAEVITVHVNPGPAVEHWGREVLSVNLGVITASTVLSTTCALPKGYRLYSIMTNRPSRVRIYDTLAHRDADLARPVDVDPGFDAGVMLEFVSDDTHLSATLSPLVDGVDLSVTPDGHVGLAVTNLDAVDGAVVFTLEYVRTE